MLKIRPIHGLTLRLQLPPDGTHQVPWASHADPSSSPNHPGEGGQTLCGSIEGHPQTKVTGGQEKRMDISVHVEAHRQYSLHKPGPGKKPNPPTTPRLHNQHDPEGGQEMGEGGRERE